MPEHLEIRIIKEFLIIPIIINNERRWLEFANIQQQYLSYFGWMNIGWVD